MPKRRRESALAAGPQESNHKSCSIVPGVQLPPCLPGEKTTKRSVGEALCGAYFGPVFDFWRGLG